jgi:DNA gyrase subunit A
MYDGMQRTSIHRKTIEEEMKRSYIDYAMSVIVGRALPDVRDGFKPVHRRILYGMKEMGNTPDKPFKKSARIVGEVLGKDHPHGDMAVYDTLARMAQEFSLRYPLIQGQGNFGSIDGDPPAAMRYTEARLSKIAMEVLEDIETLHEIDEHRDEIITSFPEHAPLLKKKIFTENFDATLKEPVVLPGKFPNLLANGSSGIAVGMSTNIPPHNLSELVDAISAYIDNPEIELPDLMGYIRGPDFPTGGIIYGTAGIYQAYREGKGKVILRARHKIEGNRIIITELPYMVNKSALLEDIAEMIREKKIEGISDIHDESDRRGIRVVIDLKRDAISEVVLNQLFMHTALQVTFNINNLVLVNGKPKTLSLKEMMKEYVEHRVEMITLRSLLNLKKAQDKEHIIEGLIIAAENIRKVIEIITGSRSSEEAQSRLRTEFSLTEKQASAILEMKLGRLTGLEREKLAEEKTSLQKVISELKEVVSSRSRILSIVKQEVTELKEKYGDERRTVIEEGELDIEIEDLIPKEDVVVMITNRGYIKRIPLSEYREQRRGGKGLMSGGDKEDEYIVNLFITNTHSYILFFTNRGKCYWLKGYKIPEGSRSSRGKAIINLLPKLEEGERIQATIPVGDFNLSGAVLIFATRNGLIKKTPLIDYSHIRSTGIKSIRLLEGDELVDVALSDGSRDILLASDDGYAVRFDETQVRSMGRCTQGVRGINLKRKDGRAHVVAMAVSEHDACLLTITENGYGKRSALSEYRKVKRGGKGVITIKTTPRNGKVVSVLPVKEGDHILVTTVKGMVIRIPVSDFRIMGRNVQGVRVMRLEEGDCVAIVERYHPEEEMNKPEPRQNITQNTP